jgi:hypothetical protein
VSDSWSIYIDIEGFSVLWDKDDQVLWSLGELMRAIFRLARQCYPREPDRLFAHQFGDGFVVVSDFYEESLERCATVATAIMRHVAGSGCFARGGISEGQLSDIQGCYPKEVLEGLERDQTVSLEMGIMTINPVMGTALTRAVGVHKVAPRGPLLAIHSSKASRLGASVSRMPIPDAELMSIDWVHMQSDLLTSLQQRARLNSPSPADLEASLDRYCQQHDLPPEWKANVREFLRVPHASQP